jgi:ABC-2 type transport system ATP-binding protein
VRQWYVAAAIEFDDLRVRYRGRRGVVTAVDGLSLSVPEGGVYGFLGPNGAGKTTAIRASLGLLRGAQGQIRVLGEPSPRRLSRVIDRVGAIVEQPSFFANFTGRKNLELLARSRGLGDRVDEALALVDLDERADHRYATYSLGMKQRLAMASTLLKDPALLVFDEPANGLDPAGILEVRTLMRALADEGRTVFVSSHLLSEVEQTCDRVAIVARGRCVAEGRVEELLRGSTAKYRVKVSGETATHVLATAGWSVREDGDHLIVEDGMRPSADITRCLADAGLFVSELTPMGRSLEDVFLDLTEGAS